MVDFFLLVLGGFLVINLIDFLRVGFFFICDIDDGIYGVIGGYFGWF